MSLLQQYNGLALAEREQNQYHDSYFWLSVWDPDEARPETFQYAATAYPSDPLGDRARAELLGSLLPSVKAAHDKWTDQADRVTAIRILDLKFQRCDVFKGDTVRVARGRKVPKGLVGRVVSVETRVVHTSRYGTWQNKEDFALIDVGTGFWTVAAKHLEVVERGEILQTLFDLAS